MNNGGDVLARGGKKASFGGPKVSQEQWDAIWTDEVKMDVKKPRKKKVDLSKVRHSDEQFEKK